MENVIIGVLVVAIMVTGFCLFGVLTTERKIVEEEPKDDGWYDEEINLGYNDRDGYFTILETAADYTEEERDMYHLSDDYVGRLTHLTKETVEEIQYRGWLENQWR